MASSSSSNVNDGERDLIPYDGSNQVCIIAFVHDLCVPETIDEMKNDKDVDNQGSTTGKKKYANCQLQSELGWHFARVWGNEKSIIQQPVFMKMKEAEEKKKAVKLVAKKGFGLSKAILRTIVHCSFLLKKENQF